MQKLNLSNVLFLEEKINEIIDEVHELQDIIVKQNEMIAKQLEIIKEQRAWIKVRNEDIIKIREELPEILRQAVKEQNIDLFQNWLKKET